MNNIGILRFQKIPFPIPRHLIIRTPLRKPIITNSNNLFILIKNSNTLDRLTHIRRILFDKTGTLTQGKYQLRRSDYYGEPRRLLAIAKTLETHSTHPIAWYYSQQPVANVAMDNIEQHSGKGISGDYDGSRWHIGSAAYMQENGVEIPPADLPPPPVGEGRGGAYPHTAATEIPAEQSPPPVGEDRGGVYPHTTDADWSLMADKNNVGHKYPTYEENTPLPCEAGEGWDGVYPHTADADTTTDAGWSLMADKNNVGHKYPTYEENTPLPCEAGEGWGGGVKKFRMAITDNKAVPCDPKLTPPRPFPTGGGSALTDANTTHVYLAENCELRAHYQLGDPERDNLAATLARLQAHYHLAIASGDRAENVARLAARYGITDWHGGLDPAAKLALLEANDPEHTLMIGDGINDAPVLARASVSVAVGRANPLSQTHADIVLLKNGPEALPYLLELAARSSRITRQNLIWATVYNLTILPLAISGYLTPWIAALGMSTSSLLVIANALRIHRTPPPPATE